MSVKARVSLSFTASIQSQMVGLLYPTRVMNSVRPEIRFRPIRPFFFNPVPVPVPAENWPDRPD